MLVCRGSILIRAPCVICDCSPNDWECSLTVPTHLPLPSQLQFFVRHTSGKKQYLVTVTRDYDVIVPMARDYSTAFARDSYCLPHKRFPGPTITHFRPHAQKEGEKEGREKRPSGYEVGHVTAPRQSYCDGLS